MASFENEKESGATEAVTHEGRLLKKFTEGGPRRLALAAILSAMTSACGGDLKYHRVGTEFRSGSMPISFEGEEYCDAVDKTLAGVDVGSETKVFEGPNGRVVVRGIVEDGVIRSTVSITTPDGETQQINCE